MRWSHSNVGERALKSLFNRRPALSSSFWTAVSPTGVTSSVINHGCGSHPGTLARSPGWSPRLPSVDQDRQRVQRIPTDT